MAGLSQAEKNLRAAMKEALRIQDRFVAEPRAIDGAQDITHLGGWRAFLAQKRPA